MPSELTKGRRREVAANPHMTAPDLAARLGVAVSTIYRDRQILGDAVKKVVDRKPRSLDGSPSYEHLSELAVRAAMRIQELGEVTEDWRIEREGTMLLLKCLREMRAAGFHSGVDMAALEALSG